MLPTPYPIHLKVETGMGRLGLTQDELVSLIDAQGFPASLQLEGLMTHLADTDGESTAHTEEQLTRFNRVIEIITSYGLRIPLIHAANSSGAVRFPHAQFSLARPGIMLYGYHTLPHSVTAPDLKPVLSLHTCVAQLRTVHAGRPVSYNHTFVATHPTRIAILPIGYADGFSRRLSNRGQVLIHGHRAPIVGVVCMDMVMADVTHIPDVTVGDDVMVIGRQGQDEITADDLAELIGTIPYEVLCSIGPRVPRQYLSS
jgi:alanine racemase